MASLLRRAMVYLGLVDEEYDDIYDSSYADPAAPPAMQHQQPAMARSPLQPVDAEPTETVRTMARPEYSGVTPVPSGVTTVPPRPSVVRPITPITNARVHVVVGKDFNDAKEIGDRFRNGQPVIVNLQSVDRDLRRRMVDFCSGLCFGLEGKMRQVAEGVLLLTPVNVDISDEEKRRLQERGYRS